MVLNAKLIVHAHSHVCFRLKW